MKFVFHTLCISPHRLPLARELVGRLSAADYRYLYDEDLEGYRANLGWGEDSQSWILKVSDNPQKCRDMMLDAEIFYSSVRDLDIFEKRAREGKKTFYTSERWFKPLAVHLLPRVAFSLPGWFRLFHPSYFRMARRIARLIGSDAPFYYLGMGVWAKRDMQLVCKLFRIPEQKFVDKFRMWGYYVEPSMLTGHALPAEKPEGVVRLLWVGRLLGLKRVDDIVRAVRAHNRLKRADDSLPKITLDIYGSGVEEPNLRRMVAKSCLDDLIKLHPPVSIDEVRQLMRMHDVYVLSSDAYEGWGAVVNEALEEGMHVVGTYEAGASATILPQDDLYHAGDWSALAEKLERLCREKKAGALSGQGIGQWSAANAAKRILSW